jgi:hypothetical protein
MSSLYYTMRDAKVNIAHELMNRGWNVIGYKPNESDSMTDYYSPANWGGIATKNGFILVVDNSYSAKSTPIKKYNHDNCLSPADLKKIEKLSRMTVERGATEGEEANAIAMIEKIKNNTSDSPEFEIVGYTVAHMANPGKCKWHIEKDGSIYDKGTGISKYSDLPESYRFDMETMTFKDGYKRYSTWENGEPVSKERELSEEELKAVNSFKALILKWERIVNNMNTMGDGSKETEEQAKAQQEESKMEKVFVKEVKKVVKPVAIDRKEIKVGDFVKVKGYSCYWKVISVNEERKTFTYEQVGKKYQDLKNGKRYYDYFKKLDIEGYYTICELKEVEEVTEVEKWVKVGATKKTTNITKTTRKETVKADTVEENKQTPVDTEAKNHEEIGNFTLIKDVDTRDNSDLWVLKLTESLSKEDFAKVNKFIKSIKGNYSGFKGGFIFKFDPSEVLGIVEAKNINTECESVEVEELQQEEQETKEINIDNYNDDTIENGFIYDCHFKAWNYSLDEIKAHFDGLNIDYDVLGCDKIGFEGVGYCEMLLIQDYNNKNESILFIDNKTPIVEGMTAEELQTLENIIDTSIEIIDMLKLKPMEYISNQYYKDALLSYLINSKIKITNNILEYLSKTGYEELEKVIKDLLTSSDTLMYYDINILLQAQEQQLKAL